MIVAVHYDAEGRPVKRVEENPSENRSIPMHTYLTRQVTEREVFDERKRKRQQPRLQ